MSDSHPLALALAGVWTGNGRGSYPTIAPFGYREELTFSPSPKGFLVYQQRTWADDGSPLHIESGYIRLGDPIEWVISQPTGITEVLAGNFNGVEFAAVSMVVGNAPTAKRVEQTRRTLRPDGDHLDYTLDMAAVGQPLSLHLEARLVRS